jgi:hypothetical protein
MPCAIALSAEDVRFRRPSQQDASGKETILHDCVCQGCVAETVRLVHVSTVIEQSSDDARVAFVSGRLQRREQASTIFRIHVCPCPDETPHHSCVALQSSVI